MTSGTTVFFESSTLDAILTPEPFALQPGDIVGAGGDFGFKSDSSALLMVALRGKTLHVYAGTEERPTPDAPLAVPHGGALRRGRRRQVRLRRRRRAPPREHRGASTGARARPLSRAADARRELRVRAPEAAEGLVLVHTAQLDADLVIRLLQQLRETQGKPTAGGGMSIKHPRWAMGGHGDLADAFTLAIWRVCGTPIATPEPGAGH